jgi:hypothetical protein
MHLEIEANVWHEFEFEGLAVRVADLSSKRRAKMDGR